MSSFFVSSYKQSPCLNPYHESGITKLLLAPSCFGVAFCPILELNYMQLRWDRNWLL